MTAFMTWGWQEIRRERKNTACGVYSGLFIGRITSKEQCRSRVVPDLLFQIRSEPDLGSEIWPEPDLRRTCNFVFGSQNTIRLMKLMASAMSAAIKTQCSSLLPLPRRCLPLFDKVCRKAMSLFFIVWVTLIKIANTPFDRSVVLVLSVIN